MTENELQRLHFGSLIEIEELKAILETDGIETFLRDQFNEGVHAGFFDGMPGNIDIYVMMKDLDKAMLLLNAFLKKS